MRLRGVVLAAVVPMLLAGCGGDSPPPREKDIRGGSACRTQGAIEAQPAPSIAAAVEPYREDSDKFRISKRFGDTAEVQLRSGASGAVPATVTLVRTAQGWVVTSVVRC